LNLEIIIITNSISTVPAGCPLTSRLIDPLRPAPRRRRATSVESPMGAATDARLSRLAPSVDVESRIQAGGGQYLVVLTP
jgi:hypothetical protein